MRSQFNIAAVLATRGNRGALTMTDKQWGEIIAWLQKTDQQLIVPLTGPIIIRKKRSAEAAEE